MIARKQTPLPSSLGESTACQDAGEAIPWPRHVLTWLLVATLALGVLTRAVRYLPAWPVWGDEAALAINIFERDYGELTQPLDNNQIAPVGFLWATKWATQCLGFHEWSLRLFSFTVSLAALFLMVPLARRCAPGIAFPLAVGIFAVSHYLARYAAEIKQYAGEMFCSTLLVSLALGAARLRPAAAWGLLLFVPLALLCALPAVFVAGGISLALLTVVWRHRSAAWWCWWIAYNLAVGSTFLTVYWFLLRPHLATHASVMTDHWIDALPPIDSVLAFAVWLSRVATGAIFAHPFGGINYGSLPWGILFLVGLIVMWRRGQHAYLRLVAGTFFLALIAALLHKYPLGGHARLVLYLTPLVTIPIAVGFAALLTWRVQNGVVLRRRTSAALVFLLLCGIGNIVKDLMQPYANTHSIKMQSFAKWFWSDYTDTAPGAIACVSQEGKPFSAYEFLPPREFDYLLARYAPHRGTRVDPLPKTITEPTGLLLSGLADYGEFNAAVADWRAKLQSRYDVFRHDSFVINRDGTEAARYEVIWIRPTATLRLAERPEASSHPSAMTSAH